LLRIERKEQNPVANRRFHAKTTHKGDLTLQTLVREREIKKLVPQVATKTDRCRAEAELLCGRLGEENRQWENDFVGGPGERKS
jgi:hypothetical protein